MVLEDEDGAEAGGRWPGRAGSDKGAEAEVLIREGGEALGLEGGDEG